MESADLEETFHTYLNKIGISVASEKDVKLVTVVDALKSKNTVTVEASSDKEKSQLSKLISFLETNDDGKVTVADFIKIAKDALDGNLPKPNLNLTAEEIEVYKKSNVIEKVLKFPKQTIEYARYKLLLIISTKGSSWFKRLLPLGHFQTLIYIFVYSQLTKEYLLFILPLLLFHLLFFSMVLLTFKMFCGKSLLDYFFKYASKLNILGEPGVILYKKKEEFIWKSSTSYLWFILVSLITSFIFPLCSKDWIWTSMFCIIALLLTVGSVQVHSDVVSFTAAHFNILITILILIRVFANHIAPLKWNLLSVPISPLISLDINVASLTQTFGVCLLLALAAKASLRKKYGIQRVCFPTIVCLIWTQMFIEFFELSTWKGLFQVGFGWILAIVAAPLLIIYFVAELMGLFASSFSELSLGGKLACTCVLFIMVFIVLKLWKGSELNDKQLLLLSVAGGFAAILIGTGVSVLSRGNTASSVYHRPKLSQKTFCYLYETKLTADQIKVCTIDFIGKQVKWEGIVKNSGIIKVENKALNVILNFPTWSHRYLKCFVGSSNGSLLESIVKDNCSLFKYNKYFVFMKINIWCGNENVELMVNGGKQLLGYLDKIQANHTVMFKATLTGPSTFSFQKLYLDKNTSDIADEDTEVNNIVFRSLFQSVKLILGPVISIKDESVNS